MKRYNLKMYRMKQGLTQKEMATKLGISKSNYVSIELGLTDPSFKFLQRFSEVFNYSDVWDLFKKGD